MLQSFHQKYPCVQIDMVNAAVQIWPLPFPQMIGYAVLIRAYRTLPTAALLTVKIGMENSLTGVQNNTRNEPWFGDRIEILNEFPIVHWRSRRPPILSYPKYSRMNKQI